MKELGRGTAYNIHNATSLILTPQVCVRHLADGRSLHGGRAYTHIHTHTHTHTHTNTHTHTPPIDKRKNKLKLVLNINV